MKVKVGWRIDFDGISMNSGEIDFASIRVSDYGKAFARTMDGIYYFGESIDDCKEVVTKRLEVEDNKINVESLVGFDRKFIHSINISGKRYDFEYFAPAPFEIAEVLWIGNTMTWNNVVLAEIQYGSCVAFRHKRVYAKTVEEAREIAEREYQL